MHIAVTRTGGVAGMTLRNEVDTATLPPDRRREMEKLVEAARAARIPHDAPVHPDGLSYEVTIDGKSFLLQDGTMPAEWSRLIDAVSA